MGALNAFNAYEPTFVEVPTDNVGLIPEELDFHIKQHHRDQGTIYLQNRDTAVNR